MFSIGTSLYIDAGELQQDRYADIVFGEKLSAAKLPLTKGIAVNNCQYIEVEAYPGISVMLVDGIVKRVETTMSEILSANSPFYELAKGEQSFAAFKRQYPQVKIIPHEYENGFYLQWFNKAKTKAIVVDYIDGKVGIIKAGIVPEVLFVEGCA